jgi:hypothetical protein
LNVENELQVYKE